jgi:Glyoxalase/Bleomycin resistance protein/Dioxygenase superfamily
VSRFFGDIRQIGYVVRDIHASMEHWVRYGVGPWFYIENAVTDYFRYRGEDSAMTMTVAIANSGDIQIDLIQPTNDAPRCTKIFGLRPRRRTAHRLLEHRVSGSVRPGAQGVGYTIAQEGSIGGEQGRFAYLDTEFDQGTVIEISDISGPKGQMFAYVRDVAASWDGADPIRVFG